MTQHCYIRWTCIKLVLPFLAQTDFMWLSATFCKLLQQELCVFSCATGVLCFLWKHQAAYDKLQRLMLSAGYWHTKMILTFHKWLYYYVILNCMTLFTFLKSLYTQIQALLTFYYILLCCPDVCAELDMIRKASLNSCQTWKKLYFNEGFEHRECSMLYILYKMWPVTKSYLNKTWFDMKACTV